jgi:hypothetical protein
MDFFSLSPSFDKVAVKIRFSDEHYAVSAWSAILLECSKESCGIDEPRFPSGLVSVDLLTLILKLNRAHCGDIFP